MLVGSHINFSRPCVEVTESVCTPSLLDMSYLHQFHDRALKSPIIMEIHYYGVYLIQNYQEILRKKTLF